VTRRFIIYALHLVASSIRVIKRRINTRMAVFKSVAPCRFVLMFRDGRISLKYKRLVQMQRQDSRDRSPEPIHRSIKKRMEEI
jgi:hypothetical protein